MCFKVISLLNTLQWRGRRERKGENVYFGALKTVLSLLFTHKMQNKIQKAAEKQGISDFLGYCICVCIFCLIFLSLSFSASLSLSLSLSYSFSSSLGQVPPDRLSSFSPSMACLQFKEKAVRDLIRHYAEILPLKLLTLQMCPLQFLPLTFTGLSSLEPLH